MLCLPRSCPVTDWPEIRSHAEQFAMTVRARHVFSSCRPRAPGVGGYPDGSRGSRTPANQESRHLLRRSEPDGGRNRVLSAFSDGDMLLFLMARFQSAVRSVSLNLTELAALSKVLLREFHRRTTRQVHQQSLLVYLCAQLPCKTQRCSCGSAPPSRCLSRGE